MPSLAQVPPLRVLPARDSRRRPTVFLDRDGVINVNRPDHVKRWSEFEFLPGALDGLRTLSRHGWRTVVITNQAVINRGLVSRAELDGIHRRMSEVVDANGGRIEAVLSCPHRPEENCDCRKPRPGLLYRAAARLDVSLPDAILVGDHVNDLQAAHRAGCRSMLVLSGRTSDWRPERLPSSCTDVLPNLAEAARQIVSEAGSVAPIPTLEACA